MNEIDWSKAPEGVTHYYPRCYEWYKVGSHEQFFWNGREWAPARFWDDRKHDCIQRPTTPSWSGEGLPPVGVVCRKCYNSPDEYHNVKILAHDDHCGEVVIYRWIEGPLDGELGQSTMHLNMASGSNAHWSFRPIRTPEQIAADEREAAIDAMLAATPAPGSDISLRVCEKLYDAGYRKP